MGDIGKNCKENTPPMFILLPICYEAETDLFFNLLRKVVSRGRTEYNFLENALVAGMTGEKFQVDSEDLSVDWTTLTSDTEQIWQSKLLGIWATRHFPSIGKKLIGGAWQPPERCGVEVIGSEMTEEQIVTIVFKKMKRRIIELNVSISTQVSKLKYFVRAPATIGKINVTIKSPSMRAFDIENVYLQDCWKALKVGEFSSTLNFEQQANSISKLTPPHSILTSDVAIEGHPINDAEVSFDAVPIDKSNTKRSSKAMTTPSASQYKNVPPCNVVLTDFIQNTAKVNVASELTINPAAKRARFDVSTNGEPNFDTLQVLLFEMRGDIENLTKWFDPNVLEEYNGPERLHLTVFKQKDAEISKLRASLQSLTEDNELLKASKTQLRSESEAKSDLISALQKGVEANSKLHEKSHEESNVLARKLSAADQIVIKLTDTNRILKEELHAAKSRLGKMESISQIEILNDTIRKLQDELNATNSQSATIESNLQSQIQNLAKQLSEADDKKVESTNIIRKLQDELNATKSQSATIESNLQSHIQNLAKQLSEADDKKVETTNIIRKLLDELNATKSQSASIESNLQSQIQNLAKQLSEADDKKVESTNTIRKLQGELNATNSQSATIESNFQSKTANFQARIQSLESQIQNFIEQLSETNNIKIEMSNANIKLQEELNSAKINIKELKNVKETLNDAKLRFNNLLCELKAQIVESEKNTAQNEKINVELASKNEKLQEELDALKQDLSIKVEELSLLKSSMEKRHESNFQNDLIKTPDIPDSCSEVEPNAVKEIPEPVQEITELEQEITELENKIPQPLTKEEEEIKEHMLACQFGWIKFYEKRNLLCPGFVQPADANGVIEAQMVTMNGTVSNRKHKFFSFAENIPDSEKDKLQVKALNKLNKRFHVTFE